MPNPARKALQKELAERRRTLAGLKTEYAQAVLDNPEQRRRTVRGFKIANAELGKRIRALESQITGRRAQLRGLPRRVPIGEVLAKESVVKFDEKIAYEEDIEQSMQHCVELFGPIGRYIHPPKPGGVTGGIIFTPKYGKLWYGDIAT